MLQNGNILISLSRGYHLNSLLECKAQADIIAEKEKEFLFVRPKRLDFWSKL